jgi:peptidoglycan/xylan/chitin deacetylase (PgdA/CDA1 family)
MSLLAVNHHYVAAERPAAPRAIYPIAVADFEAELRALAGAVELVSRDAVIAAAAGEEALPQHACLVTFDDGLRCQLELAVPVLERLGIPFVVFVCGLPLAEGRALRVHKIHALRERISDAELLVLVQAELGEPVADLEERAAARYRYDTPAAAQVKYLVDVALTGEERERFVDRLFGEAFDEAAFCRELYLSAAQLEQLEREHGAVGAHSYDHGYLALMDAATLADDLARNVAALRQATGVAPRAISYPYGTPLAVSRAVATAAEDAGFRIGFTMERALNLDLDDPLLLARIDTNDAPTGSHPVLSVEDGAPAYSEAMAAGRAPGRHELEPA